MDNEYFSPINTVSRELGIPAYTLRYWEKQFPTVLRPTTGAGGRRYYRAEMVAHLRVIQDLLYNRGLTIAGVKKLIKSGEFHNMAVVGDTPGPVSENNSTAVAPLDNTKIDLAIGLLNQAKDLLKQ